MLQGREPELTRVDALLDGARKGTSGALVVRGEPGIGKTALLDEAAQRADGMRVLRGAGIESEAELPFAGLHLLLGPVRDRVDALPGPQRAALAAAFGLDSPSGSGDRFLIGAAVLSLLADAAEDTPVLCLVDDAQWLDRASTEALLFAARRLDQEGVVVLFGIRDYAPALTGAGLPELKLHGLPVESAAALLDEHGTQLPVAAREQLVAETRGNPLALLELPALLATSGSPLSPMPLTSRVLDAFHHQVRSLPASAQRLLLLAAADDTGDLATLLRAAAELRLEVTDLEAAESTGLVRLTADAVTFRHPLIRAAAYHGAPLSGRLAAHHALAAAYANHRDADRRAWHLAVAATGPTEQVAAELTEAADRALRRGGHAAAASAYERAAQLSEDMHAANLRLTRACEAGLHSGRLDWARSRAERALPAVTDAGLRARLIEVQAGATFAQGELRKAHDLLTAAVSLHAGDARERAFWMQLDAMHAAWASPTDEGMLAETVAGFDAFDLAADDPLATVAWLVRWATAVPLGRDTDGFPPLDQVVPSAIRVASAAGPRSLVRVGTMTFAVGRDRESTDIATTLVADARAAGTVYALPGGLGHLTVTQTLLGQLREAKVSGAEGLRIAADTGQPVWVSYTSGALAYLSALQGDEAACQAQAAAALAEGDVPTAAPPTGAPLAGTALALLHLGAGRVQQAYDQLLAIAGGPMRHQSATVRSVPDRVEAAVRLGQRDDAVAALAGYAAWATAMRQPWIDALLARCHALTASDDEAEPHYQRALELHATGGRPFERARTELSYGEWLRRARRKTDARSQLAAALRTFDELGATPWATRARTELNAAGGAAPTTEPPDAFADLTPQELQISQLAAGGMSNRDIAARLYLSPRTVAYHLYKAYPKLGINSRAELRRLLQG